MVAAVSQELAVAALASFFVSSSRKFCILRYFVFENLVCDEADTQESAISPMPRPKHPSMEETDMEQGLEQEQEQTQGQVLEEAEVEEAEAVLVQEQVLEQKLCLGLGLVAQQLEAQALERVAVKQLA